MLRCGPWNRQPLTIRWLKQEYQLNFDPARLPPVHMPTAYGPVVSRSVAASETETAELSDVERVCAVCKRRIQVRIRCRSFCDVFIWTRLTKEWFIFKTCILTISLFRGRLHMPWKSLAKFTPYPRHLMRGQNGF